MNEFRTALEKSLRGELLNAEWEMLVEEDFVSDWLLEPTESVESAARRIRQGRAIYGLANQKQKTKGISRPPAQNPKDDTTVRQRSVSFHLWLVAQEDSEVKDFRDRVLQGQLLPFDPEVNEFTERLLAAKARGDEQEEAAHRKLKSFAAERTGVTIPSVVAGEVFANVMSRVFMKTEHAAAAPQWFLLLRKRLATEFGWDANQAAVFLMTNACPVVSEVMVEARVCANPSASKLVLTIDPTASPQKVAEVYLKARTEMVGGKFRSLTDKHALLAFMTWRSPTLRPGWTRLLREWNELVSDDEEWQYSNEKQFRRDGGAAQKRLYEASYLLVSDSSADVFLDTDHPSAESED